MHALVHGLHIKESLLFNKKQSMKWKYIEYEVLKQMVLKGIHI